MINFQFTGEMNYFATMEDMKKIVEKTEKVKDYFWNFARNNESFLKHCKYEGECNCISFPPNKIELISESEDL